MPDRDSQLLCTFSKAATFLKEIEALADFYVIDGNRIYVLQNSDNSDEVFLTFNAMTSGERYYPRTISVHRKKNYNVLYSINALNELVKLENAGTFSVTFDIPWIKYKNSLITVKDGKLKITPTKLLKIFYL